MGDHALGCAKHGERIARHNLLRDLIFEAASNAALVPLKDERHLLPGTAARPGDILIRRWADGKDAALNVTVTSPFSPSNLAAASGLPTLHLSSISLSSVSLSTRISDPTFKTYQIQNIVFFPRRFAFW